MLHDGASAADDARGGEENAGGFVGKADGAADGAAQREHAAVERAVEEMERSEHGAAQGKAAQEIVVAAHAEAEDEPEQGEEGVVHGCGAG